jgi:hypothetical protein
MARRSVVVLITTALTVLSTAAAMSQAGAEPIWSPTILHVGQINQQEIAPLPNSEPDTLVEPDIEASPTNPNWAVAATHEGRYPDGGAVDIAYAWTHDGGKTWHRASVQGITTSAGGVWDRASDPVVAWGPDGSVYLSILPVNVDCQSAVYVTRSTDGGQTFGTPVLAHYSDTCAYSDDKNWLVVDNFKGSPHFGRLYQFWTPFISDAAGNFTGAPQALRWSDDKGRTWSETTYVSDTDIDTQNSQPMIQPNGAITDAYLNYGHDFDGHEGPEGNVGHHGDDADLKVAAAAPAAAPVGDNWVARTSHDGGQTWTSEVRITNDAGEGPAGIRCCLPSATADPVSGRLFTAWDSATPDQVKLSQSLDGRHWSRPVVVSRTDKAGIDRVNVDVTAYRGDVFVSYGTRDTTVESGRYVQQQVSESPDGVHFRPPVSLGPRSDLNYAAVARGKFPGDYAGSSAVNGRLYVAWALSSAPADPTALFHQVLYGAVLKP